MKRLIALAATVIALQSTAVFAEPSPPTNGGNGGGSSGQCTGPAADRPTSCQSPGGVSGK
jgi:opacity protein-like surface antigen